MRLLLILSFLALLAAPQDLAAQKKLPSKIKVANTKRPNSLHVDAAELASFYQNYDQQPVAFNYLKVVKTDSAYYLLSRAEKDTRIFAFELKQKGKRLSLSNLLPVQTCGQGDLTLDNFVKHTGKITGCLLGRHVIIEPKPAD
ncbi:MAG: hypothetical protein AAB316_06590 [Bacteroidota bacterium]